MRYHMLAMADEISRDTLLSRVREQGEVVRRLKAAKVDNTQVREFDPSIHFPPDPRRSSARRVFVTDVTSFLLFCFRRGNLNLVPLRTAPRSITPCHRITFTFFLAKLARRTRNWSFHFMRLI